MDLRERILTVIFIITEILMMMKRTADAVWMKYSLK